MEIEVKLLEVVDGETLMDMQFSKSRFCIQSLLPQGVSILGGAPKIGKSWMVLDWCVKVAKGESVWNLPTEKGTVLYLCLEDSLARIQDRLNCITDEVPSNLYVATKSESIETGLIQQIQNFIITHTDTTLIVIDTFQMIRNNSELSYANDYNEIGKLKQYADEMSISILLVHHLRKQGDNDPLNKLSGTTAISGAVDAVFVLDKDKRNENKANLLCTGRDIEQREFQLSFNREKCIWDLINDSLENPVPSMPQEMIEFIEFMKVQKYFKGSNTDLVDSFNSVKGYSLSAKSLKQMMNKFRYELEDSGVQFVSHRSNGQRLVEVSYQAKSDSSAVSDETNASVKTSVPFVSCDPVGEIWADKRRIG
ncbi:MAG: AAA family ATPase [Eubacterium sp.]|nr:AAA family ATPase [Eubacterium sp.]